MYGAAIGRSRAGLGQVELVAEAVVDEVLTGEKVVWEPERDSACGLQPCEVLCVQGEVQAAEVAAELLGGTSPEEVKALTSSVSGQPTALGRIRWSR
jgi:hypothetical protein